MNVQTVLCYIGMSDIELSDEFGITSLSDVEFDNTVSQEMKFALELKSIAREYGLRDLLSFCTNLKSIQNLNLGLDYYAEIFEDVPVNTTGAIETIPVPMFMSKRKKTIKDSYDDRI